jgi:hypothetical protein
MAQGGTVQREDATISQSIWMNAMFSFKTARIHLLRVTHHVAPNVQDVYGAGEDSSDLLDEI